MGQEIGAPPSNAPDRSTPLMVTTKPEITRPQAMIKIKSTLQMSLLCL
jgi:hypothetical protein